MNKKLVLAGLFVMSGLAGCAAISKDQAKEVYGSGHIIYAEINNANAMHGKDAIKYAESSGTNICNEFGLCDELVRDGLNLQNGNIKHSVNMIMKMNVLTTNNIIVKNGDILIGKCNGKGLSNVCSYFGVADKSDCKWNGTGVICRSGWDYRKDLPLPIR